jgi:hypothetical protein
MIGSIRKNGLVTLVFDLNMEKFLSPDGTQQCLPCEHCGDPQWVTLATCSVTCDRCVLAWAQEDAGDLEVCTPHPENVAWICGDSCPRWRKSVMRRSPLRCAK